MARIRIKATGQVRTIGHTQAKILVDKEVAEYTAQGMPSVNLYQTRQVISSQRLTK